MRTKTRSQLNKMGIDELLKYQSTISMGSGILSAEVLRECLLRLGYKLEQDTLGELLWIAAHELCQKLVQSREKNVQ